MMIVDVDAHHYENEHFGEILPFMENDVFKQLAMSGRSQHPRPRPNLTPQTVGFQDMGGRVTRYPMRGTEKTPGDGGDARRRARPPLDGRDERRLLLPVPDRHALHRPASAERDGGRAVLGLQPLAHREGAAGFRRPLLLDADACRSPIPTRACARSRSSATASTSAASWSPPSATTSRSTTTAT